MLHPHQSRECAVRIPLVCLHFSFSFSRLPYTFCVVCKFDKFIGYIYDSVRRCAIYGAAMWITNKYFRLVFSISFVQVDLAGHVFMCTSVNVSFNGLRLVTFVHCILFFPSTFFALSSHTMSVNLFSPKCNYRLPYVFQCFELPLWKMEGKV